MDELLGGLRGADGRLDSEGAFTLDPQRALAILRQHMVLDPAHYVLPLYQAALGLGAEEMRVVAEPGRCRIELPGAQFAAPQHASLAGHLLRASGGLRFLAMAVFTALNLPRARVDVSGDGVRSRWTPELYVNEPGPPGPLSFELRGEVGEPALDRCALGPVPVWLNGRRLAVSGLPAGTVLWRRLRGPERLPEELFAGLTGSGVEVSAAWSGLVTYGPDGPGAVTLVAAGLTAVEKLAAPEGVGGVISCQGLRWDLSWQHPVQDESYQALADFLAEIDPELARQAAPNCSGALRELVFRNLRRLRRKAPRELWEAPLFLQAAGEPLSLEQLVAAPPPLRYTRRHWELAHPSGVVQLRSGQELGLLSSFLTLEDGDDWLARRRRAEQREADWRASERLSASLGGLALEGYAGEVAFGEGGLTLLKEFRLLGRDLEVLPAGVVGIINCDEFTPHEDWSGVRHDAVWRRALQALAAAVGRLYERAPAQPPADAEVLVEAWMGFWAERSPRPPGWDVTPPARWPVFPTQAGERLAWVDLRSLDEVWFIEEPLPPRVPRVTEKVLVLRGSVVRLLRQLLPGVSRSLLDEHPDRPRHMPRRGPLPAARLLLRSKILRGDLAVPWDPHTGALGAAGLELHVLRQGGHLGSLWMPLGYGPIVAEVELPGAQVRENQLVLDEVFRQQLEPVLERCRQLALKLASELHRYSDLQWGAVRNYLLRQLVAESAAPRYDEVWGALGKAPLFPTVEGQNLSYADLVTLEGPIGFLSECTLDLTESPLLLLSGEALELARRLWGERLVDRSADLARVRCEQSQVVLFLSLPPGETLLERPWGADGLLGLLRDPTAISRIELFEGRRRRQTLTPALSIPLVAALDCSDPPETVVAELLGEARRLVAEGDQLPVEYRVAVALRDPELHALPVVNGLLRPWSVAQLGAARPVEFLTPKAADKIYQLEEVEPFLEAFGRENPPILERSLEALVPWELEDLSLEVERALAVAAGQDFPEVRLGQVFPGRSWLARSPLVGRLMGEVGLPAEGPGECVWLLPRGEVRLEGPQGICAVVWTSQELEDERLSEALPLLAQTLERDLRRRAPRPELAAWLKAVARL